MALTDIERQLVKKIVGGFCEKRTPQHLKDQLSFDYKVNNQDVILVEKRTLFSDPGIVVQQEFEKLKYVRSRKKWKLYWMRAGGKLFLYDTE